MVDEKIILFYKQKALQGRLSFAQKYLTDSQNSVYLSLCNKLNVKLN